MDYFKLFIESTFGFEYNELDTQKLIDRKILLDLVHEFDIQFFLTGTEKSLFSFGTIETQEENNQELYSGGLRNGLIKTI